MVDSICVGQGGFEWPLHRLFGVLGVHIDVERNGLFSYLELGRQLDRLCFVQHRLLGAVDGFDHASG